MRFDQFIQKYRWYDSLVLSIFIICFSGATWNHVNDILRFGLFPYSKLWDVPEILNIYWTSLTILDPLAVVLLFARIRSAYVLALFIMITDVGINTFSTIIYSKIPILQNHVLLLQAAFLVFLLVTVKRIWRLSEPLNRDSNQT